jgi:Ca2+-binding EF-hand superfamily protein
MWNRILKSDSNGDGMMSKAEMKSDFDKMSSASGAQRKGPSFDEMFSKMDANGDGNVTAAEFSSMKPPMGGPPPGGKGGGMSISDMSEQLWKTLLEAKDKDKSGSLSKTELFGSSASNSSSSSTTATDSSSAFRQIDTNQDGDVSQTEFSNFAAQLKAQINTYMMATASNNSSASQMTTAEFAA